MKPNSQKEKASNIPNRNIQHTQYPSHQIREPFSEYAKARVNGGIGSPLVSSNKVKELRTSPIQHSKNLSSQGSPCMMTLSSLLHHQTSPSATTPFSLEECEVINDRNLRSINRGSILKEKENFSFKAVLNPFQITNQIVNQSIIPSAKLVCSRQSSTNTQQNQVDENKNPINQKNSTSNKSESKPNDIEQRSPSIEMTTWYPIRQKREENIFNFKRDSFNSQPSRGETASNNIRRATLPQFSMQATQNPNQCIRVPSEPRCSINLKQNESEITETQERSMFNYMKRGSESSILMKSNSFSLNFKNFNLNFKQKLKSIGQSRINISSNQQLPTINVAKEQNSTFNFNNIARHRSTQPDFSPSTDRQQISQPQSPNIILTHGDSSSYQKQINKIISPTMIQSRSSLRQSSPSFKKKKNENKKCNSNCSINQDSYFKADTSLLPPSHFASPRLKESLKTVISSQITQCNPSNLRSSKRSFNVSSFPSVLSLCSIGISENEEQLPIASSNRLNSFHLNNNCLNLLTKNESQQEIKVEQTSKTQQNIEQISNLTTISREIESTLKREICDILGELREDVRNMIEASEKWKATIEVRLKMSLDQFLYLLQHFWRYCLHFKSDSRETNEFRVFKLDNKRLTQLQRCMHQTLSRTHTISESNSKNFMNSFHSLSQKLILSSSLIDCLGGQENTQCLLDDFVESVRQGLYEGQALGVSGIQVCEILVSVLEQELGLKSNELISETLQKKEEVRECITQVEFFLAKRAFLHFLCQQKWIQKEARFQLIERLESRRTVVLHDHIQSKLIDDEGVHSALAIKLKSCKVVTKNFMKKEKGSIMQLIIDTFQMTFNKLSIRQYHHLLVTYFSKHKMELTLNKLEFYIKEVITDYVDLNKYLHLIPQIEVKFSFLRQFLNHLQLIHVQNRGGTVFQKLQLWAVANFKTHNKHISITETENYKLELMESIIRFYFHRNSDVFSILDVASAFSHFRFTKNALEFWLLGLHIILRDPTFQLKEEVITSVVEDLKKIVNQSQKI